MSLNFYISTTRVFLVYRNQIKPNQKAALLIHIEQFERYQKWLIGLSGKNDINRLAVLLGLKGYRVKKGIYRNKQELEKVLLFANVDNGISNSLFLAITTYGQSKHWNGVTKYSGQRYIVCHDQEVTDSSWIKD